LQAENGGFSEAGAALKTIVLFKAQMASNSHATCHNSALIGVRKRLMGIGHSASITDVFDRGRFHNPIEVF
jgi:hypothetical protein